MHTPPTPSPEPPSLGPWLLRCTSLFLHCSFAKRPEPTQHYQGCLRSVPRIRTASFLMRRATLPSSVLTTPVFFSRFFGLGVTRRAQLGGDEWRGYGRRWTLGTGVMCRSTLTNWLSRGRRASHPSPLLYGVNFCGVNVPMAYLKLPTICLP